MLQTPETYKQALDAAMRIPSSPDWNFKFRQNLVAEGLNFTQTMPEKDEARYPDGFPYQAPLQYPDDCSPEKLHDRNVLATNGWPEKTYIIWSA